MGIKFEKKPHPAASEAVAEDVTQTQTTETDDDTPPFADAQPAQDSAKVVKAKKVATKKASKKKVAPDSDANAEVIASPAAGSAKVEQVQPTATVTKQHQTKVIETSTEPVGPVILKTEPMANVGLSVATTKNLGNYESVKYSVSLFMPSAVDEASLNTTFATISSWVDAKMGTIAAELAGDADGE